VEAQLSRSGQLEVRSLKVVNLSFQCMYILFLFSIDRNPWVLLYGTRSSLLGSLTDVLWVVSLAVSITIALSDRSSSADSARAQANKKARAQDKKGSSAYGVRAPSLAFAKSRIR
jgi:hypothetical protein